MDALDILCNIRAYLHYWVSIPKRKFCVLLTLNYNGLLGFVDLTSHAYHIFSVKLLSKIPTFINSVRDNCNRHRTQPYMIKNCVPPVSHNLLRRILIFALQDLPLNWKDHLPSCGIVDFKALMFHVANLSRNESVNYKLQIYVVCIIEQLSQDSYQKFDLFS